MSPLDKILSQALRLTRAEREQLVQLLEESVLADTNSEGAAELGRAWEAEIERRLEMIDSGKATMIPWSEVREMIFEDPWPSSSDSKPKRS